MAIPKRIFGEVGLFDEKFIPSEEIELERRIEKKGYKLALAKNARVWHLPKTTIKGFLRQIYGRGFMKVQFTRRHKTFEPFYFLPLIGVLGLISLIFLSLFSPFFKTLLLISFSLYLSILILDSFLAYKKIKTYKVFFLIPVLMFLQHFIYGLGTLIGILRRKY